MTVRQYPPVDRLALPLQEGANKTATAATTGYATLEETK